MSEAMEQTKEPPQGYKKFQIGPETQYLPEDWDVIRLGNEEYAERTMGGTPDTDVDEYWGGKIPWMRSGDIHQKYITNVDGRITEKGKEASRAEIIPKHSVLIGLNGQGKTKGTVGINEIPLTANQSVGAYLVNHEKFDYRYLYFSLDAKYSRLRALAGGGRSGLNLTLLGQVKIPYPPLPEQRRIADILSTVDEQIHQTDEMIEKTEELKRGLMQDLITGGLGHTAYKQTQLGPREVEIPDKWAVERMDDVAEIVSGGTPKKSTEEYWDGDIVWVTPTDVTGTEGMYISDSAEKITEEGFANASTHMLEPGAVLMTSRATIGEAVINTVPATTNQGFKSLVPEDRMHNEYLYYYVRTIADYLTEIGGGSTFPEINKTDTKNIRVPVPPLDEQKRIADVINQADTKRLEEREHKQHLQDLKRGLMQDLLTGTVRVSTGT